MSGINDIIAYGFGGWSTVAKLPTLGFGIGAALALDPDLVLDETVHIDRTPEWDVEVDLAPSWDTERTKTPAWDIER